MRVRRPLASLLAAGALLLSACGDTKEKNDYVTALNKTQTTLAQRFGELRDGITATSTPAQDRRSLTGYETAVRDAVRELRAIEPPSEVADLHHRFIDDVADYGTEVRRARDGLATSRPQEALAAQQRLTAAAGRISGRINRTITAINDKLRD
jgi:hypothetical protein